MTEQFDLEGSIRKAAATARPMPGDVHPQGKQANGTLIMEACNKAADMVRNVHQMHQAEGETLAQHIEKIGETFSRMCQEAAKQVRATRIMPQEMAESTANDLAVLGQMEFERFNRVTQGLIAARDALMKIDKQQKDEHASSDPNDHSSIAHSRPVRTTSTGSD